MNEMYYYQLFVIFISSVVMRRDQIHKICLNHKLTSDIEYKPKDSKSWQFIANDYSEGTYELDNFCLRFKTDEIARDFKKAIDDALAGEPPKGLNGNANDQTDTVSNVTAEEGKKITDLKLPNDFFEYKSMTDCSGCRGCSSDDFVFSEVKDTNFGQVDDNPLPLNPPPKVEPTHNDLSKDSKNTFSFASFGNDSKGNGFGFAPATATTTANNTQPTGMFFGNNSFKSPFSSGSEKKDATNTTPVFGQSNMFGGNVTKAPSAEAVKSSPSFSFNTSAAFGGNSM